MQDNINTKLKPLIFKSENNKIIAVTENKKVDGEANKKYYQKIKSNPDYMERSRISSKKHYDSHKEEVLTRIKKYQKR